MNIRNISEIRNYISAMNSPDRIHSIREEIEAEIAHMKHVSESINNGHIFVFEVFLSDGESKAEIANKFDGQMEYFSRKLNEEYYTLIEQLSDDAQYQEKQDQGFSVCGHVTRKLYNNNISCAGYLFVKCAVDTDVDDRLEKLFQKVWNEKINIGEIQLVKRQRDDGFKSMQITVRGQAIKVSDGISTLIYN